MLSLIFFIDTNEGFLLQGARNKVPKFFCLFFFFLLYSFKDFSLFDFRKQILAKLSSKCPKKRRKKERHYKKPGELLLNTA